MPTLKSLLTAQALALKFTPPQGCTRLKHLCIECTKKVQFWWCLERCNQNDIVLETSWI